MRQLLLVALIEIKTFFHLKNSYGTPLRSQLGKIMDLTELHLDRDFLTIIKWIIYRVE